MTTTLETMQQLMQEMHKQLDATRGKGLQENRRLFDMTGLSVELPENIKIETAQVTSSLQGDWLIPASVDDKSPVMLFVHGGGYSVGSPASHRPLAARLAHYCQCRVFSLNYRLAPEHKFPAALDDAVTAYQWLRQQHPDAKTFIAGDSAGGGLTMATLLALRDRQLPMPGGAIGISAWLDLECTSASYAANKAIDLMASAEGLRFVGRAYANKGINRDPLVSPFYATDLKGLCPLLIQVGSAETLLDENTAFARQAEKDGVAVTLEVWPNMVHVWHSLYGRIPEAQAAIEAIGVWVRQN